VTEFEGVFQPSHVDGKVKIYFPRHERRRRFIIVSLVTLACIGLVIGAVRIPSSLRPSNLDLHPIPQVVSIYIMRAALSSEIGSAAQVVSSVVNAVQIQFFKYWYVSLADTMTEWENPRTDTEFEDAMIPKLYLFEVIVRLQH
jgi:hypothetical protein